MWAEEFYRGMNANAEDLILLSRALCLAATAQTNTAETEYKEKLVV